MYRFDGLQTSPQHDNHGNEWGLQDDLYEIMKPAKFLSKLEWLFGFRSGTSITIHLRVGRGWLPSSLEKEEWECDTVIPIMLPTLRRLTAAGAKVKVCLEDDGCEIIVAHGDVTFEEIKEQVEKVKSKQGRTLHTAD
jgi:hypothetical protein